MKLLKTTCPRDCYDGCGMIAEVNDNNEIISLKGDKNHPVTQGFLCPRGSKDIQRLKTNRVCSPKLRKNGALEQVEWDEAFETVSTKIKEIKEKYGADKILYLDYAGNEGLVNNYFAKRLWYEMGATFSDGALCTSTGHKALNLHYGLSYGVQPTDLEKKDLIVFWGINPAVTSPHVWKLALKARKKNNAKIAVIDVFRTTTAKRADLFIQTFPGTDTAVSYSIINQLIETRAINKQFINDYTLGFDDLKKAASEWTLTKASEISNVNINQLQAIADLYSKSKNSATYMGIGLQKREYGSEPIRAISFIPSILGHHRGFFYANSSGLKVDTKLISGENDNVQIISQVEIAKEIIKKGIRLIYVNSTNPLVTHPDSQLLKQLFCNKKIFVVVNETHWSETAKVADVVFPVPTFLEKEDVMLSWGHKFTRFSQKIIEPITDSKTEVEIMTEIAKRLGYERDNFVFDDPFEVVKKSLEGAIEKGDIFSPENNLVELKTRAMNEYQTPSGKIEFTSTLAVEHGLKPLPEQKQIQRKENQLLLISTAVAKHTNSQFNEVYGNIPHNIYIHPKDAKKFEINNGDKVYIKNENGKMILFAQLYKETQEGVLWLPRFTTDIFMQQLNSIVLKTKQEFGNGPKFHSTYVTIKSKRRKID